MNEKLSQEKINETVRSALILNKGVIDAINITGTNLNVEMTLNNNASLSVECENGITKVFILTDNEIDQIF